MTNTEEPVQPAGETFSSVLTEALTRLLDKTAYLIGAYGEAFLLGLLIIVVGWITAALLRALATRLLRAGGLDVVADRIGLLGYLERRDIGGRPSVAIGWILYAAVLYSALILAFDRMGLDAAAGFLRTVAALVPHVLVVFILLLLGLILGKLARNFATGGARLLGLPAPDLFGTGARAGVFLLALVVALDYVGWASTTILLGGLGVLLLGGLGSGLLFALSARRLTESLLARGFLTATYRPGDRIRTGDTEGTILKIDATVTRIKTESGEVVLPNRRLHESRVEVLPEDPS
ncbi:MAG: mechanosensitive ion channel [Opitutales bacterium]|nr:mechanosensitive ion channel [Opitutales bacterium]